MPVLKQISPIDEFSAPIPSPKNILPSASSKQAVAFGGIGLLLIYSGDFGVNFSLNFADIMRDNKVCQGARVVYMNSNKKASENAVLT